MHIRRMKHLAEVARAIPERKLDMHLWGRTTVEPVPIKKLPKIAAPVECHTIACLLGWAAFDPKFNKEGLCWKLSKPMVRGAVRYTAETNIPLDFYRIAWKRPWLFQIGRAIIQSFREAFLNDPPSWNLNIAKRFFELDDAQANELFMLGYGMTGAQKAAQIEAMIEAERRAPA